MRIFSLLFFVIVLGGCDASSETTCENPNANDPVCTLDSRRLVSGAVGEDDVIQACTSAREGLVSYDGVSQTFQVCRAGRNEAITVAGQGPAGPVGPAGPEGPAGGGVGEVYQYESRVLAPGESLELAHNLGRDGVSSFGYFERGGVLRPVSEYRSSVGRRSVMITGAAWNQTLAPEVFRLSDGNVGVLRENVPEAGQRSVVLDIWSDEGVLVRASARVYASMATVRAISVSNGVLLVYELAGGGDEVFEVIGSDGQVIVGPTVIGPSPATNRVKDVKRLSNGNVVVAQQIGGNAAFHILDPVAGVVVASNSNVAVSSDYRTIAMPEEGQFHLYFSDLTPSENSRFATYANDGTAVSGPRSSGFGDETVFGADRVDVDRFVVVTSYVGNVSSRVLGAGLSVVRAKVIHSALSVDGASPLPLGGGKWVVCSTRSEGYCVTYDREGEELFRNGDLFQSETAGDYASMAALGSEGRFVLATRDNARKNGYLNFLQGAPGRLDLERVDNNRVKIVNRTVESLSVVLTVLK